MNASPPDRVGSVAAGRINRNGASPGRVRRVIGRLFDPLLDRIDAGLVSGSIEAGLPDGRHRLLGGRAAGPVAIVTVVRWRALIRLATGGSVGWYEGWARQEWDSPEPVTLFELFMHNRRSLQTRSTGPVRALRRLLHRFRRNAPRRARRNIAFHYDLGEDFYAAWLDPGLTYSSALFDATAEPQTLEAAQASKLDAMLARTRTTPGQSILEIGCGWGSFAETAARAGRRVEAITLSAAQQRAAAARLARSTAAGATVRRMDYRDVDGRFDAVVSIEMIEAVGQEYWSCFIGRLWSVLKPGGRAAIQFIAIDDAIFDSYAANVDFIQAYIFPGGMLLSERRFRALAEARGFEWSERRAIGPDYAETLRIWRARFDAAIDAGRLPPRFDGRFAALWRYYLMYCEGGFRGGGIDAIQITLIKPR